MYLPCTTNQTLTYGIDVKSSNSASKEAFLIDYLEVEESQGCSQLCRQEILCEATASWQVTVKTL